MAAAPVGARRGDVEGDGLLVVRELRGGLDALHHGERGVGVPRAEEARDAGALEEHPGLLVVRLHHPGVAEERDGRLVLPRHHQHGHPFLGLPLQELAQRHAATLRAAAGVVAHERDPRVHRPPRDVHEMPRVADGRVHVLPKACRPVLPPAFELDRRAEPVGQMGVLVQRDVAVCSLREEGRLDPGENAGPNAGVPARVAFHVEEAQPDAEPRRVRVVARAVAASEVEPEVERLARGDAGRGHGCGAQDAGADEVLALDGESDGRGRVSAVQAEGLVPGRVGRVELHLPGARHPRRAHVHVHVDPVALEAVHAQGLLQLPRRLFDHQPNHVAPIHYYSVFHICTAHEIFTQRY